jgi:hypothetical protein
MSDNSLLTGVSKLLVISLAATESLDLAFVSSTTQTLYPKELQNVFYADRKKAEELLHRPSLPLLAV